MNEPITFGLIFDLIKQNLGWVITLFCLFFEISPIKISPISWLAKIIFAPIRTEMQNLKTELKSEIDSVKNDLKTEIEEVKNTQALQREDIQDTIRSMEMSEMSRLRWEILTFANSLRNNQVHTRDEYRHIKDQHKKYHGLIKKYDLDNGLTDEAMQLINNHYEANKDSSSVYF